MTSRVSTQLKKRLQSSLESLTAKEAGRLYAIYALEADKKGKDVADYAPANELIEAMVKRARKAKKSPEEREAVLRYNGFLLLTRIWHVVNTEDGPGLVIAYAFDTYRIMAAITTLLQQDATTEFVRHIRGMIQEKTPVPVSEADYDRLIKWAKTDDLKTISEAAYFLDETGEEDGDPVFDAIYNDMVARLEAGELEGGEGFHHFELDGSVLIEDGKIPAWAALRLTWRRFVGRQGLRIFEIGDFGENIPAPIYHVGGPNGQALDDTALRDLAANFYKDCRRRPWGKGLVAKPDVKTLVELLIQEPNPFFYLKSYDFGRVDWEAFQKSEVDREGDPFESEPVATVGSLGRLPEEVGRGEVFDSEGFYRERYYPTSDPESIRRDRSAIFAMMARLDISRQPFSYDRLEEGMMSMSDIMGIKFLTPLETQVENLRRFDDQVASFKAALQTISDRYFGGLPIFTTDMKNFLEEIDDNLATTKEVLSEWIGSINRWPWNVDTSALEVGEPEVDEDEAATMVDRLVKHARALARIEQPEELLFAE